MSFSSASSWKTQSNRVKNGNMSNFNNENFYGINASFNNFESKNGIFKDISSNSGAYDSLISTDGYFHNMNTNKLFISNLGQNFLSTERWVNVDICNQLICVDLSSSGNYTTFGGHTMLRQKTAYGSTAIGYETLRNISTRTDISFNNTAVGTYSMTGTDVSLIIGIQNSAFGNCSLNSIYNGNNNSAFGFNTLSKNASGNENTAIGSNALSSSVTGDNNTAVGYSSLGLNTLGDHNVGIGSSSLNINTSGSYNVACGSGALNTNNTGNNNSSLGYNSLFQNTSGYDNCAVGYSSMQNNLTSSANTAVGSQSLYYNSQGQFNVAIGKNTLYSDISGSFNTVVGALSDVTQLDYNCNNQILGYNNISQFSDVNIIGTNITNSLGPNRTFINNIRDNSGTTTSNIMVFDTVTNEITYATDFIRRNAVDLSGISSVSIGGATQDVNIIRDLNMSNNGSIYLTSDKKFSLWRYDLSHVYIGYRNGGIMSGNSLFTMDVEGNSSTEGGGLFYVNNAGGMIMLQGLLYMNDKRIHLTNGLEFSIGKEVDNSYNVYFGHNGAGNANVKIDNSGNVSTNGTGKCIVNNTGGLVISTLGTGSLSVVNGQVQVTVSDPSLKKNIVPLSESEMYTKIEMLNPVNFEWIDPGRGTGIQHGFLATDIQKIFPNMVSYWVDGSGNRKLSLDPIQLIPVVVSGMKKQNGEIALLQKENASLKEDILSLREELASLRNDVKNIMQKLN